MYKLKNTCRCCGSCNLKEVLDLNSQPLANSYHLENDFLQEYPLKINVCQNCWHAQLSVVVDPDSMFKNYLYVSGTSQTLKDYFDYFYKFVIDRIPQGSNRVLDIACNDGSQLDVFKRNGWTTYGIDPAENLYEISNAKGFTKIICNYFNEESVSEINDSVDVIIAQNVFAHTDDVHDFLRCCKLISHDNTKIFIQTSQANMFENNQFDTIYHEHLSFFCAKSMNECVKRCGLHLEDIVKTDIHGTSYVFVVSNSPVDSSNIYKTLEEEENIGKHSIEFYKKFAENSIKVTSDLKKCLDLKRKEGYTIVGYGAAAKGMTLLNFGQINLDFIVDDNPLKHDLLTPGMNIPIKSTDALKINKKMCIVPLAWNFYDEIISKVQAQRNNAEDVFVRYFPQLELSK